MFLQLVSAFQSQKQTHQLFFTLCKLLAYLDTHAVKIKRQERRCLKCKNCICYKWIQGVDVFNVLEIDVKLVNRQQKNERTIRYLALDRYSYIPNTARHFFRPSNAELLHRRSMKILGLL